MAYELYEKLGVDRNSSLDDIKRAYKKLAIKHHPDKGGDEKVFQDISNAYSVLSDPKKKQQYDMTGSEQPQMNMPHPHDIFQHFFNMNRGSFHGNNSTNRQIKCKDILHNYEITLEQAFTGLSRQVKIKMKTYDLTDCKECEQCQGIGIIKNIKHMGIFTQIMEMQCPNCKGSGSFALNPKTIEKEKIVQLEIPEGVESNYQITIDGCGEQPKSPNCQPGNLVFLIKIKDNIHFKRINNDLYHKINIGFIDSICGIQTIINILNQDKIELNTTTLGILQPNKQYVFQDKGMKQHGKRGNLFLEFIIDYPLLNDDQRNIISTTLKNIIS